MKRTILIGGMPTAGKSTLARVLARHLNLPWLSTDHIGTIMREVANRAGHPNLYAWEDYASDPSIRELTTDVIATNELAKAEAVWPGVRKLVLEDYTWNDGFIIEGDDILPHLVAQDFADSNAVNAIFVGDFDVRRIRNAISARDLLWDKEREVEWVQIFGEMLKAEAERYGFAWIELEKNGQDLGRVLAALGLS